MSVYATEYLENNGGVSAILTVGGRQYEFFLTQTDPEDSEGGVVLFIKPFKERAYDQAVFTIVPGPAHSPYALIGKSPANALVKIVPNDNAGLLDPTSYTRELRTTTYEGEPR